MTIQKEFTIELEGYLASRYAMLTKSLSQIKLLNKTLDVLTDRVIEQNDETISQNDFFINYNIWISLYTQYHFLFSKSIETTADFKSPKHQSEETDLKEAPEELRKYHQSIMEVRNHYIVHGGSNIYNEHSVYAQIVQFQEGLSIKMELHETKAPNIRNENIPVMSKLLNYLEEVIRVKIQKVEDKIGDKIQLDYQSITPNSVYRVDK